MPDFAGAEKFIFDKMTAELPGNLTYHGIHHTLDVLDAAQRIGAAESLSEADMKLLRVAVYFHDVGFISVYRGHEEIGCQMARELLPAFGFDEQMIENICGMIMATHLPQEPMTLAEQVIADADLDYLGRDDFYKVGNTLFEEFKIYMGITSEEEWNQLQLKFLRSHEYHTQYSKTIRSPEKAKRMREIETIVQAYQP